MTGFYSIFYNHPAHFCRGLVVAVVMPQYSAGTPLQRPFCSHAPSQKHGVTSMASSGKGGPAGLFCSPLVCVFCLPSSSSPVPSLSISPGDLHSPLLMEYKKKSCSGSLCFCISIRVWADCPAAAMDVAFGSGGASEGITRHLAQHSCVTVTLLRGRQ